MTPAARRRCVVAGATGYVGQRLIPRLIARGNTVRALARTPSKLDDVPWRDDDRADVFRADLADIDSLREAFADAEVVYHLVHSMSGGADFAEQERMSAHNVASAARTAGVRRIIYLGGLHPENASLSEHLASRAEVGDILIGSGVETVALQAGTLIGSGSASFELIRHLTERLPVMTTPRWVHNKIQPIAIDDALHYLVAAADAEVGGSRTWDIGGPDVLEYRDMIQEYAEVAGLARRRMIVLPWLTPTIANHWVSTVTPIRGPLTRPLIESLECDAVCRNRDINTVIAPPPDGLLNYLDALLRTLDRVHRGDAEVTWQTVGTSASAAEPLPSDPEWAGEQWVSRRAYTQVAGEPGAVWDGLRSQVGNRWRVLAERRGEYLHLRSGRSLPGTSFITYRVVPVGSSIEVRTDQLFCPRGLIGRLAWPLWRPFSRRPQAQPGYGRRADSGSP